MELCSCGHLDNNHVDNELFGRLEGCKSCKCKTFEWAGTTDGGWDPANDEDFEADLDEDEDEQDWRLVK